MGFNSMQTTRHPLRHLTTTIIALFVFLVAPALISAAEKPKKAPTKQTAKKTTGSSARSKTTKKAVPQVNEETARASFETFTQEWMAKLAEAEEFHRIKQVQVSESSEGFSAEYLGYLPERSIEIRKTEYADTPFVGTLSYQERTLRCIGKSKEAALQGPFQQVKTSPVREIFRFTKGKWVY
jgi:hypothetical protein